MASRTLLATTWGVVLAVTMASSVTAGEASTVHDGGGDRELAMKYCNSCHTFVRVERAGGSPSGWTDRIHRMNRWGAKVPDPLVGRLATYLAQTYPVPSRMANLMAYTADLAFATVSIQPVQQVVRVAAVAVSPSHLAWDGGAAVCEGLAAGQRVRAFRAPARGSVTAGRIEDVSLRSSGSCVARASFGASLQAEERYLAEVIVDRAPTLAVPSEAILDEGMAQHVFVCDAEGTCDRRDVRVGRQGERLTEILDGLSVGEQVATLGSYQLDAEARRLAVASNGSK